MTLGLEVIKFMLEQDEDNVPIVQHWIDKWFWRGHRLLSLVGMMMDYMLPKKVMSWKDAWEMYFEEQGGALFDDLGRYGIRPPLHADIANKEKDRISHEVWAIFYQYTHAAGFHTWDIDDEHKAWLSESYPDTFDKLYRPRLDLWKRHGRRRQPLLQHGAAAALPGVPDPDGLHRARRSDHDLLPLARVQGRPLPLLQRRLPVHLRPRAGEVRPGVVAGAPDLPGQLRRGRDPRCARAGTT